MAVSSLYKLNKGNATNKASKKTKKLDKLNKSKPKSKEPLPKHTHGPSSLDNKNILLDSNFLKKAVDTFKNRESQDGSSNRDLLDDSTRKYVFLQFKLSKLPPEAHVRPLQIPLKNPIYLGKDVCVFVKDPQKTWKSELFGLKIPEIKKVIGVSKLRKKYKTYEDRRLLCNSFDLFLCDKSVVPSLPSLLGSHFIEKKKLPVGVSFSKNKLKDSLLRALNSTYYKLSQGSCVSVKVASSSMSTDHIVENIVDTLESVKKFHMSDENFKNHICSVFLNWGGSESLPLYSEDLLEVNRINDAAKSTPFYWIGARSRPFSSQKITEPSNKYHESETRELVSRIYRLARTGQTSVELWRDCTARTVEYMDKLDLKGLCSILHSYGYMKYRDGNMLELMAARLIENIRMISSDQIASVLRAYSILKFRSDFLFRLMIPEISLRLDMMNAAQVSSIFYSFCNLGYYNKNLFQSIQSFIYKNIDQLKPYDLTLLLGGYCKNFKGFDDKFLTVLSFQFCKLLDSYDNKLFSLAVNSLSRLNFCNHKYLPSLIESEVYNRVRLAKNYLPSKSIALILNGLSKHNDKCTPVFTFLSENVVKRLKEFDLHSLCLVLSAFSRVSLSDSKAYDKIAEYIGKNSLKLYPRAVASVLYSYSRANHLHGPLLYFSAKHLEVNIDRYSCDELAMIMRSFALLGVKNEDVMLTVSEYILKSTPDYVPIKFEDLCAHQRVSKSLHQDAFSEPKPLPNINEDIVRETLGGASNKLDPSYPTDRNFNNPDPFVQSPNIENPEEFNINLLEVFSPRSDGSGNYLSTGKMHSLLWIVEAYAKFLLDNDHLSKALTRIANELVVRMVELDPYIISRLVYSFSQLNFRHSACLEMLLNEITNPRDGFKFDQKELSLIHYSLMAYGLDTSFYGIYKFKRLDFQKVLETNRAENGGVLDTIRRIVTKDIPSPKPLYLRLLSSPLSEHLYGRSSRQSPNFQHSLDVKRSEHQDEHGFEANESVELVQDATDVIYIHIPRYVKQLVQSKDTNQNINTKLTESLHNHISYNFNLD